ncbi:MAG: hypothetical protein QY317_16340 [Candidatus Jettenia caeni]|nr:MAG: hypothetical protein QY317_16340 [Candidatus Jettenia caeni]
MNKDRRKIVGTIFADAAKYTLTAGVIGSIISGKFVIPVGFMLGITFFIFLSLAYFITPKDKEG